jgi:hypothetical protein
MSLGSKIPRQINFSPFPRTHEPLLPTQEMSLDSKIPHQISLLFHSLALLFPLILRENESTPEEIGKKNRMFLVVSPENDAIQPKISQFDHANWYI